jgi:small nuclear ribonucleoprotein (snRNP)-like protein/branched-subunit amino acid aminotransferase/4-amino-4-deoxychorismate lyase
MSALPLEIRDLQIAESRCRTSSDFLLKATPGAYTQCRTIRFSSILMLSFHLRQLSRSFLEVEKSALESLSEEDQIQLVAELKNATTKLVSILLEFTQSCDLKEELLVTILYSSSGEACKYDVSAHACVLPTPTEGIIRVCDCVRPLAEVRDSSWIRNRAEIDTLQTTYPDDEIIFSNTLPGSNTVQLLDGTSSNLFVISGHRIYTAKEGVYSDDIRTLVLLMCGRIGITAVEEAPILADVPRWDGAFLTSGSRLLKLVHGVSFMFSEADGDGVNKVVGAKAPAEGAEEKKTNDTEADGDESTDGGGVKQLKKVWKTMRLECNDNGHSVFTRLSAMIEEEVYSRSTSLVTIPALQKTQPTPASDKIESYLNRKMRVVLTDKRIVVGYFECFDQNKNLVLSNTEETHPPEEGKETEGKTKRQNRRLGMAMVPGKHIVSCEVSKDECVL